MTKRRYTLPGLATGLLASLAFGSSALAQSSDAIIDKLVEKGILTSKEANDLRDEADKNFTTAYQVKSGIPDWVTSLKISGDFRGRFEGFYSSGQYEQVAGGVPVDFQDRTRFRYRLRLGVTAVIQDNFEVGLRLTSSEPSGAFGGDPISGNTTFDSNGSKKFIYVDLAYAKWSPLNTAKWSGSATFGKMENPFTFTSLVFDGDYTPEGFALQGGYNISDRHVAKMNLGGFVLNEIGASSANDAYLGGVQFLLDSTWSKKISTSLGVAALGIMHDDTAGLNNADVPNVNRGNTRDAAGNLIYHYNPIVGDLFLTYTLDTFPMYTGTFPIRAGGEVIYNPAPPSDSDNYGYTVGVLFGRSGRKGTWDVGYQYRWLGANAWYEELVDSDFGALYQAAPPNSGGTTGGYFAGTNVKGHIVRVAYSPYDSLTLSATWFATELINPVPAGSDSEMNRVQVDAAWKF